MQWACWYLDNEYTFPIGASELFSMVVRLVWWFCAFLVVCPVPCFNLKEVKCSLARMPGNPLFLCAPRLFVCDLLNTKTIEFYQLAMTLLDTRSRVSWISSSFHLNSRENYCKTRLAPSIMDFFKIGHSRGDVCIGHFVSHCLSVWSDWDVVTCMSLRLPHNTCIDLLCVKTELLPHIW